VRAVDNNNNKEARQSKANKKSFTNQAINSFYFLLFVETAQTLLVSFPLLLKKTTRSSFLWKNPGLCLALSSAADTV